MTAQPTVISFGLLQTAFQSEHYASLLRRQANHDAARGLIAELLPYTENVALYEAIIASALGSNYQGNTLKEVAGLVRGGIKRGLHENYPPGRQSSQSQPKIESLISTVLNAGHSLYHDGRGRGFMAVKQTSGGWLHFLIRSSAVSGLLRQIYFRSTRKAISATQLTAVQDTLDAIALHEGETRRVFNRVGGDRHAVWIDLGRADGMVVKINAAGWSTTYDCPAAFYRGPGALELPVPCGGGSVEELREFLGLEEQSWFLLLSFIMSCLRPQGPYFCMLIEGEQGSGKSYVCRLIKLILDPNDVLMLRLPDSERDLMIHAKEFFLLVYDNVSGMKGDLSDALCSLATGAGFGTRQLYTDDALHMFKASRPFVLNGISEYANRPDLLERAIPLTLSPMPTGRRRTETEMDEAFTALLPEILGSLYEAVAHALASVDLVTAPTDVRMADAARWIKAAEPALAVRPGALLGAVAEAQNEVAVARVFGDPLVEALQQILGYGPFAGTVGELMEQVSMRKSELSGRHIPPTPAHLSRALARLRPALTKIGISLEYGPKVRFGKLIVIWREEQEKPPFPDKPKPLFPQY